MALLSIEGVRKEYQVRGKKVLALDSVDLTIAEGEFVTIVGPSGLRQVDIVQFDRRPDAIEHRDASYFAARPSTASAQKSATSRRKIICCPGAP